MLLSLELYYKLECIALAETTNDRLLIASKWYESRLNRLNTSYILQLL